MGAKGCGQGEKGKKALTLWATMELTRGGESIAPVITSTEVPSGIKVEVEEEGSVGGAP